MCGELAAMETGMLFLDPPLISSIASLVMASAAFVWACRRQR